jgi:hypothetical protein
MSQTPLKGPTSNLRSLAGQLIMEGHGQPKMHGQSLTAGFLSTNITRGVKNSELQTFVQEQLKMNQMAHDVRSTVKDHNFHTQTFVTGTRIDDICEKKEIKLKNVSS